MKAVAAVTSIVHARQAAWTIALAAGVVLLGLSPLAKADRSAGRDKAALCVACHGENGLSVQPNAPHLAGQPAVYLADQLRQFRSGKRPSEVMAVIAKPLTDQDIDDLALWYSTMAVQSSVPP